MLKYYKFFLIAAASLLWRREMDSIVLTITTAFLVLFLAKFVQNRRKEFEKRSNIKLLPPGRRGWPLIGDSLNWYNAVASSHPPAFVEQQVQRYLLTLLDFIFLSMHIFLNKISYFNMNTI